MRRYLAILLMMMLLVPTMPVMAADQAETVETMDIGSYAVWRHSDGKTWTAEGEPGDVVTLSPTIQLPVDDSRHPENFSIQFVGGEQPTVIGGKSNDRIYWDYGVDNGTILKGNYLGGGKYQYSISTKLQSHSGPFGMDVTQRDWQGKLVLGLMYYVPVKISWSYPPQTVSGAYGAAVGIVGDPDANSYILPPMTFGPYPQNAIVTFRLVKADGYPDPNTTTATIKVPKGNSFVQTIPFSSYVVEFLD